MLTVKNQQTAMKNIDGNIYWRALNKMGEYCKYRGYTAKEFSLSPAGITVTTVEKPEIKHFTQVTGNIARLSWKDLDNELIVGNFKF